MWKRKQVHNKARKFWVEAAIWLAALVVVECLFAAVRLGSAGFAYYAVWACCMWSVTALLRECLWITWLLICPPFRDGNDTTRS